MRITVVFNLYDARKKFLSAQHLLSPPSIKYPCKKFKNLISVQGACSDHYGISILR